MPGRVLSALMFFPRGGSAHVARALARALPEQGWDVTVLSGSQAGAGDARRFYAGLDVRTVDFDAPGVPMHPSFEDRPDAPDPVFASLDDAAYEEQVAVWADALRRAGAADADVLHLHHLTPVHEAAARVAPEVPVVGHLHGTELLMLEEGPGAGAAWPHFDAWAERMRGWAARCRRLVVLSGSQVARAEELLGIDGSRCVVVPNGFDPATFRRLPVDRARHWRRVLVEEPRGWSPDGPLRYDDAPGDDTTVLLSVGRFTAVKRTPLLIEAFARARPDLRHPAALVVVGGHPGEWEGEHPAEAVERLGARDVYLAGWHDHDELPESLSAADALALASVREQFGQVLVEAMACELPVIAVDRFGPADIVRDGETGRLVEPDDVEQLAAAITELVNDPAERRRRGQAARQDACDRFGWPALAARVAEVLDAAGDESPLPRRSTPA
jgi:glycosyltransferase involved in cell wall biosynthesis